MTTENPNVLSTEESTFIMPDGMELRLGPEDTQKLLQSTNPAYWRDASETTRLVFLYNIGHD
jgi:hypothetical protein